MNYIRYDSDFHKDMISMFPDAYNKFYESNLSKLIRCIAPEFDEIMKMWEDVKLCSDIDEAYGETLTKLGLNVNQERGMMGDKILRLLIKTKIAADMSDGTIPVLYEVIGFMFDGTDHETKIEELWDGEPASMRITAPINSITDLGISVGQFIEIMTRVKAGGVRIYANMQGTFIFVDEDTWANDKDSELGFSDTDMARGGTLGMVVDTAEGNPFPI